jgi:transcriptional regulator with XRE-family HTH domain
LTDTPASARRRLRFSLREAREARELTQEDVARALRWSRSKVARIEAGEVSVSYTDVQAMIRLFRINEPEPATQLLDDARASSRKRGRWDDLEYREHLTPATRQFLELEADAAAVRMFQPTVFPGVFQTPAYAEAVIGFWKAELSEEARRVRLQARLRRAEIRNPDQSDYFVILDESVLYREAGGAKVMLDQLNAVLTESERPGVRIRILQLTDATLFAMRGSFAVLDIGEEENVALYSENGADDKFTESPSLVELHRRYFEQMWAQTLSEAASRRLIVARAAAISASLDRAPPPL